MVSVIATPFDDEHEHRYAEHEHEHELYFGLNQVRARTDSLWLCRDALGPSKGNQGSLKRCRATRTPKAALARVGGGDLRYNQFETLTAEAGPRPKQPPGISRGLLGWSSLKKRSVVGACREHPYPMMCPCASQVILGTDYLFRTTVPPSQE